MKLQFVVAGEIVTTHGIKGEVKVLPWLDSVEDLCDFDRCRIDGKDFEIENLRYNKVIILADADQDGAHIRALLLTFFYRYMRELITEGHVYIGVSPLYKIERKSDGKVYFAYDDAECERITSELGEGRSYVISRYKGLGEMNPSLLWETTMSPANRTLIRVGIEDAVEAENMVTILMGDDAARRQSYIFEHADFNRKDDFERKAGV
jgi:DNA gyrase subunit B